MNGLIASKMQDTDLTVVVMNNDGGEHPFHLHGPNFWVVRTSAGEATEAQAASGAYVLRDVVSIPGTGLTQGYAVADFSLKLAKGAGLAGIARAMGGP